MINFSLIQFLYESGSLPLGSLYLSYGLEKANIKFELKLYPLFKRSFSPVNTEQLYSFLIKTKEIIGIGCGSDMLPFILIVLEKIKKEFPKKIIILGGVGPTDVAEEIMNRFKFIDYIIKGCGVYTLPKLIRKIMAADAILSDIEGLVFRSNGGITSNYYKGYHLNIPDLLCYGRIKNIKSYLSFPTFTSFGCPYQCTFCNIRGIFPKEVVYRDLNQVFEELKVIKKMKKNKPFQINIYDEGFIINRKRVIEFCNLLKSKGLHINWTCYGRIDRIDEELLRIISKSGCIQMFYGIESGSNRILEKIKKGFTIEEAAKIIILSKKYIKSIQASFIYLYPFEELKDLNETIFWIKYLRSKNILVNFQPLIPTKNTGIYADFRKKLFLSNKVESQSHIGINTMPKKYIKLIKNNPKIFFYYYFYNFPGFNKISRKAEQFIKNNV